MNSLTAFSRTLIRNNSSRVHRRHLAQQATRLGYVKCITEPSTKCLLTQTCPSRIPGNILSLKIAKQITLIRVISLSTQAGKFVFMKNSQHGSEGTVHAFNKLLRRPLGGIETIYQYCSSKGSDIVWLLIEINTVFPVNEAMVEEALYFLAEEHPLLRMTIQRDANNIYFVGTNQVKLDLSVSERTDWLQIISEEMLIPFDISNGPLWKCRLLNAKYRGGQGHGGGDQTAISDDLVHELTVLFVMHHSVMDGSYSMRFVSEFVDALNKISLGAVGVNKNHVVPLPPPVDDMLVCPTDQRRTDKPDLVSSSSLRTNFTDPPITALDDYNTRFSKEIGDILSEQPRNRCFPHEFSRPDTTQMLSSCKDFGVSPIGLFVASSVQAFADLVYPSSSIQNRIQIPFDFMLDLRRFCPKDMTESTTHCLPGVASAPIPMVADMQRYKRPVSNNDVWNMSKSFGNSIWNEVTSPETFKQTLNMIKNSKNDIASERNVSNGKSPYVLCISNLGCLDYVVTGDITKRARLSLLHGQSSVLIENDPIFYICFYSLNGKLSVNISFCETYTSAKTTQEYMDYLKEYILTPPICEV